MDKRISDLVHFNIKEKSNLSLTATFTVEKSLPSFEGHFPGNPVLPAVSIIDISLFLLENIRFPISYDKIEMKRSKFMSMVQPNQVVEVRATSEDGNDWKFLWTHMKSQEKLAQLQLVLSDSLTTHAPVNT